MEACGLSLICRSIEMLTLGAEYVMNPCQLHSIQGTVLPDLSCSKFRVEVVGIPILKVFWETAGGGGIFPAASLFQT